MLDRAATVDAAEGLAEAATKPCVLVVDDEPQVLLALDDILSDQFRVLTANSGAAALELVRQDGDIATVISDQRMPGMTGDELLEEVSHISRATRILFTGFADLNSVVRAVNNGRIFAYVTKPWDADQLRMTVTRAVAQFALASELEYERRLLADLMNSAPDAICFKDENLRYVRVNRAYAELMGRDQASVVGKLYSELHPGKRAEDIERQQRELLVRGGALVDQVSRTEIDGRVSWHSTTHATIHDSRNDVLGLLSISRDVTERKQQEERIARLTRVHAMLSGVSSASIRMTQRSELLQEACLIAAREGQLELVFACGLNAERALQLIAQSPGGDATGLAEVLSARLRADAHKLSSLEARAPLVVDRDDETADAALLAQLHSREQGALAVLPLFVRGKLDGVLGLLSRVPGAFDAPELALLSELADNVSFALDHLAQTDKLNFLAYYDELTRLPKRELLIKRLNELLAQGPEGPPVGLVLIDIGRFRRINESLGRAAGDTLLCSVAERLRSTSDPNAMLARFDSNTFALLMSDAFDGPALARRIENTLVPELRKPFVLGENELRIPSRIAIALGPADGADAETLLRNAEAALSKTRSSGERYLFYVPSMNERVAEKLALENRLRRAIETEEFVLYYQPKVELKTGCIVGLEALIRWRDPEQGLVPPAQFIPLLEETGLILEVGGWVFRQAAAQYTRWTQAGLSPPPIAVNVSSLELAQSDFLGKIAATSSIYPLTSEGVELEITESVLMDDMLSNIEKLRLVRLQGLRVAIDDFGTGYSSLGYLSRLPIDALKVDRTFVWRMGENPQDMTIVMTIISLAHALDLKVIAEGPETFHQAHLLRLLKCDQIQGYLVSQPVPAEDIVNMLGMKMSFDAPGATLSH